MSDYISREAALAFQDELAVLLCKDVVTGDVMSATKDADLVKYLLSIPAADVRPVRKGEWLPIIEANEYGETYQAGCLCSECNEVLQYEPNFCPNCGARMLPEPPKEEEA